MDPVDNSTTFINITKIARRYSPQTLPLTVYIYYHHMIDLHRMLLIHNGIILHSHDPHLSSYNYVQPNEELLWP
jgi:hypothetical protein